MPMLSSTYMPAHGQANNSIQYTGPSANCGRYQSSDQSSTPAQSVEDPNLCSLDHTHSHFNYDELFCCDLPCPDMSYCDPYCDPMPFGDTRKTPLPCCPEDDPHASFQACDAVHEPCTLSSKGHTPCEDPSCSEPVGSECCDDPSCEVVDNCCPPPCPDTHVPAETCSLQCTDQHHPPAGCTTCCMSDICPHPTHRHQPHNTHTSPEYVPWNTHHDLDFLSMAANFTEGAPVEPRLSAALQSHLQHDYSPTVPDPRSTPASTISSLPEPSHKGGHRRLQGATALQQDGSYLCQWGVGSHICGLTFTDAQDLHRHVQSDHFQGTGSNHPCLWQGCDSGVFNTKPKLSRHLHSHTEYKPHKCDFPGCTLSFVTQQQRDVHRKKHTGEKPFECTVCGKAFAYRDLLKSHMRSGVHGEADKKFTCGICGEGFSDSSNRTKHTKSVHDPVSGVPCPAAASGCCSYVDTRREKLRQHCITAGHGLEVVKDPRKWEEYFNREQMMRKPVRGVKRKRPAASTAAGDVGNALLAAS